MLNHKPKFVKHEDVSVNSSVKPDLKIAKPDEKPLFFINKRNRENEKTIAQNLFGFKKVNFLATLGCDGGKRSVEDAIDTEYQKYILR